MCKTVPTLALSSCRFIYLVLGLVLGYISCTRGLNCTYCPKIWSSIFWSHLKNAICQTDLMRKI